MVDVSRYVNLHVQKMPSKLDKLMKAEQFFSKGMYAITLDLRSMYHQALLQEETGDLFGFCINDPKGGPTFYEYKALPFGFRNLGALMQRLTNPLIRYLRQLDVYVNLYIDNFLIIDTSKQGALEKAKLTKIVFRLAGWTFESKKLMKEPSQVVEYLRMIINCKEKRKFIKELLIDVGHKNQVQGQIPSKKLAECRRQAGSRAKSCGPNNGHLPPAYPVPPWHGSVYWCCGKSGLGHKLAVG